MPPHLELPPDSLQTPHDPDVTYGYKGQGYKAQVAETCAKENPYQVITHVDVEPANSADQSATLPVVKKLEQNGMKPEVLFADTAYSSGENLVDALARGVTLHAPVQGGKPLDVEDPWREGRSQEAETTDALGLADFTFNRDFTRVLTCPAGKRPADQQLGTGKGTRRRKSRKITFAKEDCDTCPLADRCPTHRFKPGHRTLRTKPAKAATAHRQRQQATPEFRQEYRIRAGIESTNSELKSRHGARKLRVRRKPRVRLAMFLKTTAANVKRCIQHHVVVLAAEPTPA